MRSDGNAIRGHEVLAHHLDLKTIRRWLRTLLTRERIADAGVVIAKLVIAGYVGAFLYQCMQTYSFSGF